MSLSEYWYFLLILLGKNCSSSVRLDEDPWQSAVNKSCHRSLIEVRSGLWLSHSNKLRFLGFWTRILLRTRTGLLLGLPCIPLHSLCPQSWQVSHSLLMKRIPTIWCYHQHASLLVCCPQGDKKCWISSNRPNSSIVVSSDQRTFFLHTRWISKMPCGKLII